MTRRALRFAAAPALAPVAAVVLLVASCSGPSTGRPPDVLLISLDTLRADRLDARRDDGSPEMPNLVALERESIRFTNCVAPMAFTLPSHMTMMTGMSPESHAVVDEGSRLAPSVPVLAELLQRHGYRTFGLYSSPWLKPDFGFGRGFDDYQEVPYGLTCADRIDARVEAEIAAARSDSRPLFLFAHFFDAHSDFDADGNRLSYYSPPEYRSDLGNVDAALCDAKDRCATANLLFADREHRAVPADQIRIHFELYRRGVRYLDAELGRLFETLRRTGFWSRAVVIVVSDHGEEFREHGKFIHSQVYPEDLRVPLLVRLPQGRDGGRVDDRLVGLEDLAPTLLARLRIPAPATVQGRDLLTAASGSPADAIEVGEDKLVRTRYSLRTPGELLIWDFADRSLRLYDRLHDPGATHDIAAERPEAARLLRRRLFAELRRLRAERVAAPGASPGSPDVFEAHERAVLKSLGYLQ